MRMLQLTLFIFAALSCTKGSYPDKPIVYDPSNGTVMDHVADDIPTIIYLGEDWCPFCRRAKTIFSENAKPLQGQIKFVIVNLDKIENVKIGNELVLFKLKSLRGIPKFIVTKNKNTIVHVGNGDPLRLIGRLLTDSESN